MGLDDGSKDVERIEQPTTMKNLSQGIRSSGDQEANFTKRKKRLPIF
jgi:hypothetical protein